MAKYIFSPSIVISLFFALELRFYKILPLKSGIPLSFARTKINFILLGVRINQTGSSQKVYDQCNFIVGQSDLKTM